MVHLSERSARGCVGLGWMVSVVAALLLLWGCGESGSPGPAPVVCAAGEVATPEGTCRAVSCPPGELLLESGACQPAGLPPDMACPPGELLLESGACQPAGLPPDMVCPPGEWPSADGTCQAAGIPPEACAEGFEPDGNGGCNAILPAEACPFGQMAVPGETSCREVAPCGDGPWGTIPVEANTQFVDQAYAGGDSDGTMAKPWTTVQQGVDAAEGGAIVAVTDGVYEEDVVIEGKAVRLWGRCPGRVEIRGTGVGYAAIDVTWDEADGSEIRGIAVTGARYGIGVSGASEVRIEQVWVHDAGDYGIDIEDAYGPTSVTVQRSLVEQSQDDNIFIGGSDAELVATVVRDTQQPVNASFGWGIYIRDNPYTGERAKVSIRGCVVEQNHAVGVRVVGSDTELVATVVRETQPVSGQGGLGIFIQNDPDTGERANVSIRGCVVEQNHDVGMLVMGSDAELEATVVRATQPVNGQGGRGIGIQDDPDAGERANVSIRGCVVEQNHELGVFVAESDAEFEATVVRDTQPVNGQSGGGIWIQEDLDTGERANVSIRGCVVEQNHELGVLVAGSDAELEATVVRATQPVNGDLGWGIGIQDDRDTDERAKVSIRSCVVEQNHQVGVAVVGSDAEIEATMVRGTQPVNGDSGWGIGIQDDRDTDERAKVSIRSCVVEQNHQVGVAVVGSDAEIEATMVRGTQPVNGDFGRGISIQENSDTGELANVGIRGCVVEQNHQMGVEVLDSRAEIEATVVRDTQAADSFGGRGIVIMGKRANAIIRGCVVERSDGEGMWAVVSAVELEATVVRDNRPLYGLYGGLGVRTQGELDTGERAKIFIRGCVVEQNHQVGIALQRSDALIEATVVRDTAAYDDGRYGDGIIIDNSTATIQSTTVSGNARAGVANFASEVTILSSTITCNAFDLNGETDDGIPFSFDGSAGWQCSRAGAEDCTETDTCHVLSAGLEPPPPLDPLPPQPQP